MQETASSQIGKALFFVMHLSGADGMNLQFCRNLVKYFAMIVRHNECMRGIQ